MSMMSKLVSKILKGAERCYESQSQLFRHTLRVNMKSLASEQKFISQERKLAGRDAERKLRLHQVLSVRPESRAAYLTYAFARGKPRKSLEPTAKELSDWSRMCLLKRIEDKCRVHGISAVGLCDWFDHKD